MAACSATASASHCTSMDIVAHHASNSQEKRYTDQRWSFDSGYRGFVLTPFRGTVAVNVSYFWRGPPPIHMVLIHNFIGNRSHSFMLLVVIGFVLSASAPLYNRLLSTMTTIQTRSYENLSLEAWSKTPPRKLTYTIPCASHSAVSYHFTSIFHDYSSFVLFSAELKHFLSRPFISGISPVS